MFKIRNHNILRGQREDYEGKTKTMKTINDLIQSGISLLGKRSTTQQKWPLKTVTHKKKRTTSESNIHVLKGRQGAGTDQNHAYKQLTARK